MRKKTIPMGCIFILYILLAGCQSAGVVSDVRNAPADSTVSAPDSGHRVDTGQSEPELLREPGAGTEDSKTQERAVKTVRHAENYLLLKENSGMYVMKNRTTGKLLSLTVSEPQMPDRAEEFLAAVKQVYETAHDEGYAYGDSKTLPPCADHLISCDRMIARALWDLGCTDQRTGGMTIGNEDEFLLSHGFRKLRSGESFQRGDIVLYERTENGAVSHTCVLTGYNKATGICSRYDCGGTPEHPRFARIEPIVDPIVYQYDYSKRIRAVYRMKHISGDHDSTIKLRDLDDRNEQSQRWIAEQIDPEGFVLRSAIEEQYVVQIRLHSSGDSAVCQKNCG